MRSVVLTRNLTGINLNCWSAHPLRKLKITPERDGGVEVTRAGSHYKARFRGCRNCVFGATAEEAIARLRSFQARKWGLAPVTITPIERQLLEGLR